MPTELLSGLWIGSVNDIFLDKTIIWLGTSTGLIKFKWKKDL